MGKGRSDRGRVKKRKERIVRLKEEDGTAIVNV